MAKNHNLDKLSDAELDELLRDDNQNMIADIKEEEIELANNTLNSEANNVEPVISDENTSTVKEEIQVLSKKQIKKQEKLAKRAEKKQLKAAKKKKKKSSKRKLKKITRYETDPIHGLSEEIVEQRTIDGLVNQTNNKKTRSIPKIIFTNTFTFFNLLTLTIAGILISVKAFTDLIFLAIVTANIIIGIIQEIRAKNTIEKLSLMSAPTALVKRAGVNHEIGVSEVVLDDLLLLESGKQIASDSIVVEGSIEVNESLLTGESNAILKKPGDPLFAGSFVVSGNCSARVDKVGADNYIEQLSSQAKKYKKPKSDLLVSLKWIIRVMAFLIIPIGIFLFSLMYFANGHEYVYSIRKTAGAMIGMIPSGLFLMTSIALAVGVIRLAQKNVLVQELYCIEMLARVNCICLDKTGTITDGTMSVKNVVDYNTVSGLATKNIISAMLNALNDQNMTSQALREKFGLGKRIKHVAAIPFSSQRKYQAVTFDKYGTFILGAPEFVLKEKYELIKKDVTKYAGLGYRVLCLAHKDGVIEDNTLPNTNVEVVSIILIEDNIRPDAINTIKYFRESGVSVRVISGDNPLTVSKISQRAGIENADVYISLDGLSDADVVKAATRYTVFGRVSPAQKKLLVETLKHNGLTVAMTGDGVNDILALKEADCSIAVASGSEAARNVSHLVLLDSNFDSMPSVVAEGRRVINNVTSVASLFLTKTIFSLFLAIQALQTGTYPISTNQLILIDTLAIGLPSLVLVMEPNNNPVTGKFLKNVIRKALPGALVILGISLITFAFADSLGFDNITLSSIIVIAATHICLMVLFKACKPFNTLRKFLCGFCYSAFVFFIVAMPSFLEIRPFFTVGEYYSDELETEMLSETVNVRIIKDDEAYYVVGGKVDFGVDANETSSPISLKAIKENNISYYSIGDKKLDHTVIIPDISYASDGYIYFDGYKLDDVKYTDGIEKYFDIDAKGNLFINNNPAYTTLTANNSDYDYEVKYGEATPKKVQINLMPKVTIKNNCFIIEGMEQDDKYLVSDDLDKDSIKYTIDPITWNLLVNGEPIYKTLEDGTLAITPFEIAKPTVTTNNLDKNNNLYLNAINSGISIFEIYGQKTTEQIEENGRLVEKNSYVIFDKNDKEIVFTKNGGTHIYVEGVETEFSFETISSDAFKDYYYISSDGKMIDIDIDKLSLDVHSGQSVFHFKQDGTPLTLDVTSSALDLADYSPTISVTSANHAVINGYYTDYTIYPEDNGGNITQRIKDVNGKNYLVINSILTDYEIEEVMTTNIVSKFSMPAVIFLFMICLLAAPLMKIIQYAIPWTKKQILLVGKLLSKF